MADQFTHTILQTVSPLYKTFVPLMGGSPGELSEELVAQKRKKGWRMNCEVGEATEELENEL